MTKSQLVILGLAISSLVVVVVVMAVQHARSVLGNMHSCFGPSTLEGDKDPDETDGVADDRLGDDSERSA